MFCSKCGAEGREDASFCWNCGVAQSGGSTPTPRIETCEIKFEVMRERGFMRPGVLRFWVDAYGRNGKYVPFESEPFHGDRWYDGSPRIPDASEKTFQAAQVALDHVVENLLRHGWDYVGMYGNAWWQKRFRKVVG